MNNKNKILQPNNLIIVGKFGSPYSIKGWINFFSFTEKPKNIFYYKPWFIKQKNIWKPIPIENWKIFKKKIIIKLDEINDRNKAALFTNIKIFVDCNNFTKLNNEYYWKDLIGCKVTTLTKHDIGIVKDIIETNSNDVLIIKTNIKNYKKKDILIPFLKKIIIKIDIDLKLITIDWDINLLKYN
ncbi:ribosome maturation factor RimM [Candidatus Providencia siddallii]|uniref:Ribosome maturation factor RimM n=1 Tax=Candidatus Providencia siddallii TaxID=1715285 RepID=A0ABP1CE90_9GAMM